MSEEDLKSLENVDFTNRRDKINSPRSIEALKTLGYDVNKLYQLSFKEYINNHPEIKVLEYAVQLKRYEHQENRRLEKIGRANERRKEIIANPDKVFSKSKFPPDESRTTNSFMFYSPNFSYTRREDPKKFDKIINKQLYELHNLIENEMMMEEIKKKNNKRFMEIIHKEEQIRKEKYMKSLESKRKREIKDNEIEKKFKLDEELLEKKVKEKEEDENRKKLNELKRKELEEKELQEKHMREKMREEQMKKMLDENFDHHIKSLEERQKFVNLRESQMKKILEDKKFENLMKAKENAEKSRQKVDRTIYLNEEKIRKTKKDLDSKHKFFEECKKKQDMEILTNIQKQQEFNKKKEEEIMNVFKKQEEIEQMKIQEFHKRQESLDLKQKERHMDMHKTMTERINKTQRKFENFNKLKTQIEILKEQYDMQLLNRHDNVHEKANVKKEKTYKEILIKLDSLQMKREDNLERYFSNEKIDEYTREKRLEAIKDKMKRYEHMKMQKQLYEEEKRKQDEQLRRKKQIMLEKFERMAQKARFKKDDFYRQIFTPRSMALLLNPTTSQEFYNPNSQMFRSSDNFNSYTERDQDSINSPSMKKSLDSEKIKRIIIQDSKMETSSPLENNEESQMQNPNKNFYVDDKRNMTKEEIESLIDNKRSELDIQLFDMVTKNQVEEKKIEDMYNHENNEEEKAKLLKKLESEIKKNEDNLAVLKENNKKLLKEYSEKLRKENNV